jgi:hypothetical protein
MVLSSLACPSGKQMLSQVSWASNAKKAGRGRQSLQRKSYLLVDLSNNGREAFTTYANGQGKSTRKVRDKSLGTARGCLMGCEFLLAILARRHYLFAV